MPSFILLIKNINCIVFKQFGQKSANQQNNIWASMWLRLLVFDMTLATQEVHDVLPFGVD